MAESDKSKERDEKADTPAGTDETSTEAPSPGGTPDTGKLADDERTAAETAVGTADRDAPDHPSGDTKTPASGDTVASSGGDTPRTGEDGTAAETGDFSAPPATPEADPVADADEMAARDATSVRRGEASGTGENRWDTSRNYASAAPAAAAAPIVQEKIVERRGGFFGMFLGGIVAAAAGFGLSQYLGPNGWPFSTDGSAFETETTAALSEAETALSETRTGVETLGARIDAVEQDLAANDLAPVESVLTDLADRTENLGTELAGLGERLGSMSTDIESLRADLGAVSDDAASISERVLALEKAPMEDVVSPETVAAYERELAALQDTLSTQRETLDQAVTEQRAAMQDAVVAQRAAMESAFAEQRQEIETQQQELQAMVEAANASETAAERQAQLATLRAAAADLLSAVRTGEPFAAALDPVAATGTVAVPDALASVAEDGVPTQAELIEGFPDAARDALAAARVAAGDDSAGNRLAGFMARQLGARSVTPREGDSADAILSRVDAALKQGDLAGALTEVSALPPEAQDAMAGWTAQAQARADALAAADGLVRELNQQ